VAVSETRQRVRFTGKRTGREDMPIPGFGVVARGDVIEVSTEQAERWTTPLPGPDGKMLADFAKQGGPTKASDDADEPDPPKTSKSAFVEVDEPDELEAPESGTVEAQTKE
jgi:hypothetical protein